MLIWHFLTVGKNLPCVRLQVEGLRSARGQRIAATAACPGNEAALQWRMPELTTPTRQQKITLGEMRSSGVRGLLIYCSDYHCSHSTAISGDRWPGHIRLSDLEPLFVCQACGQRGADIRPDWDWELSRRRASG